MKQESADANAGSRRAKGATRCGSGLFGYWNRIEQVKEPASFDTISILEIKCSPFEREPGWNDYSLCAL